MKSAIFSVLSLDSRCTVQHGSTKTILLLHAQEFTLRGPLKKAWLCRCPLGSGWSSRLCLREHGLSHQHTQVRSGLLLEDFRALPPPQTWQRRGRARASLVAGVQLYPWPWLEPSCPGAGGLGSITVTVLVWCPQHGLLSGTGEGPEPSGGGRTAEGPEVSVLSEGWRSRTPGRPDPLPPRAPHPPTAGPGAHTAGPWSVGIWTLLGISLLATPLVHLTAGAPRRPWSLCPLSPGWRLP